VKVVRFYVLKAKRGVLGLVDVSLFKNFIGGFDF